MTLKHLPLYCGLLLSASAVYAWDISGVVKSDAGKTLDGVSIQTMNMAGFETVTDTNGLFHLSNGPDAIASKVMQTSVHFQNNILTLNHISAQSLKVSVINVLGKSLFQRNYDHVNGSVSIDLNRYGSQKNLFVRVSMDSQNATYQLNERGALLKEGEVLPVIGFSKDGYDMAAYTMKQDTEKDVVITLNTKGSTKPTSSESVKSSSSAAAEPASSSVKNEEPVVTSCTGKEYQSGDHKMSVNVGGKSRTFIMHVPSAYKGDKPVPLVIDYHPIGGSGQGQLSGTTYKAKTDPEGVISFYPDGTGGKSMMGAGWNVGPCCSNDDDVAFSYEMINYAKEKLCIDTKRIYGTGFSMGGGMSNHVACMMNDVFAAVAPAAMDLNITNSAQCKKTRPISVIMFRGTNDNVCRYQGGDSGFNDGLNFLGAEKNFKFWADFNECTGSPSKNSNGCDEYSNCKDGTKVVLCTKQGGGHEQGDGSVGWPFLKQFTLP
ncbi:MAG: feruloyl esterase [Fibrobacter sp.]|nr:feruloyl esterase [Fibrobacter sp.]